MVNTWIEVSKDKFFKTIGHQDVNPCPQGKWPYISLFKTRIGDVRGKTEDYLLEGSVQTRTRYLLPAHV